MLIILASFTVHNGKVTDNTARKIGRLKGSVTKTAKLKKILAQPEIPCPTCKIKVANKATCPGCHEIVYNRALAYYYSSGRKKRREKMRANKEGVNEKQREKYHEHAAEQACICGQPWHPGYKSCWKCGPGQSLNKRLNGDTEPKRI